MEDFLSGLAALNRLSGRPLMGDFMVSVRYVAGNGPSGLRIIRRLSFVVSCAVDL